MTSRPSPPSPPSSLLVVPGGEGKAPPLCGSSAVILYSVGCSEVENSRSYSTSTCLWKTPEETCPVYVHPSAKPLWVPGRVLY